MTPQLRNNRPLFWDHWLGLRGSGLIVYGALPASLGAVGVLKVPEQAAALPLSANAIPFIALVALAPVVLTYVLTRQRMVAWYVLRDFLGLRAVLNTLGIVVASTAVCLAVRVLAKPDIGAALSQWLGLGLAKQANTVGHALLLSLAFLVGSSTLFLTVIKEDSGLPLLPKKDRLAAETELRKSLVETVAAARHWPTGAVGNTTLAQRSDELNGHIVEAEAATARLRRLGTGLGRQRFYHQLVQELDALRRAVADVRGSPAAHDKYWAATAPDDLNLAETELRILVRRHAELSVHA
jgi:hypothetical protein